MKLNSVMTFLAMFSVPALAHAQTNSACVSRAEANALFVTTLPDLIDGVRNKCAPSLPSSAFLPSQGRALVERYRASSPGDWSSARKAFLKMGGGDDEAGTKFVTALPDETLKTVLGTAFAVVVANDIKPGDCGQIDRFVAALSPLPPANIAEIITGLIVLAGNKPNNKFRVCPDS